MTFENFTQDLPFTPDDYQYQSFDKISSLAEGENFLAILPTGAGKSLIAEFAIYLSKMNGDRVIYTTPLKALSTEKRDDWSNGMHLNGAKVLRDTGDDRESREEESYKQYDVLITTNERLDVILRSSTLRYMVFKDVKYLIVDEIHLLGSKGRGSTLEFLIMVVRELMPHISIIGLSATLPNYTQFANWLEATYIYLPPERRPIPLEHYYLDPIPEWVASAQKENMKYIQIVNLFREYPDDQFLIFTSSRIRTENLAKRKAGNLRGRVPIKTLIARRCGYHHAGLTETERKLVEDSFREGKIKYLFATPTLAQGVNLPAKNVIMFDLSRWSIFTSGFQFIEHYEIGQMSGRAGRRGFDKIGRCFYCGTDAELQHAEDSVNNPRPMVSQIADWLDDKILALSVANMCQNQEEITDAFSKSFMEFQDNTTINLVPTGIDFLIDNHFLFQDFDGHLSPTSYGKIASRIYVKPRTAHEVFMNVMKLDNSKLDEVELIKTFLKNGEFLMQVRVSEMDSHYINEASWRFAGFGENVRCEIYNPDFKIYEKVHLTNNWLKALGLIFAEDLNIKVYGSKQETAVLRRSASEAMSKIHSVLKNNPSYAEKMKDHDNVIKSAVQMLAIGTLDPEKVKIILLPQISTVRYAKLVDAGITSFDKFMTTSNSVLANVLRLKEDTIEKIKRYGMEEIM